MTEAVSLNPASRSHPHSSLLRALPVSDCNCIPIVSHSFLSFMSLDLKNGCCLFPPYLEEHYPNTVEILCCKIEAFQGPSTDELINKMGNMKQWNLRFLKKKDHPVTPSIRAMLEANMLSEYTTRRKTSTVWSHISHLQEVPYVVKERNWDLLVV